jgi:nucleotide-binding universal stress UspA family protein
MSTTREEDAMTRWVIGVDVGPRSRGALHFSRWFAEAMGVRWSDAFVAVHVLDDEHLRAVLRGHHLDEAVERERAAIAEQLAEVVPGAGGRSLELVRALTVDEGLERARARHGATGVVVSRMAPRESHRMFRLGGVARRLLGRLASPVLVVPPDLTVGAVGGGPIVAASSLAADSIEACRLARALADDARRDLTLVHVVAERSDGAAPYDAARPRVGGATADEAERALARWGTEHGVWPELAAVVVGEFPAAAVAFSEARGAPLVAVGAVPAPGVRGAIAPKLWRWLAAHARAPVLVVPAEPAALPARLEPGPDDDVVVVPAGPPPA